MGVVAVFFLIWRHYILVWYFKFQFLSFNDDVGDSMIDTHTHEHTNNQCFLSTKFLLLSREEIFLQCIIWKELYFMLDSRLNLKYGLRNFHNGKYTTVCTSCTCSMEHGHKKANYILPPFISRDKSNTKKKLFELDFFYG